MRPLTDATPKPLLAVHGKPLIEWHLEGLARDGVRDVVVNTAWLEDRIVETLGDGSRFGLTIHYSCEGRDHGGALETAGGIATALPLLRGMAGQLDSDCFWVVSGDIHVPGFRFDAEVGRRFAAGHHDAHLWLVPNPVYHPNGDFGRPPTATRSPMDRALTVCAGPTPTSPCAALPCFARWPPAPVPRSDRCCTPRCASAASPPRSTLERGRTWERRLSWQR